MLIIISSLLNSFIYFIKTKLYESNGLNTKPLNQAG